MRTLHYALQRRAIRAPQERHDKAQAKKRAGTQIRAVADNLGVLDTKLVKQKMGRYGVTELVFFAAMLIVIVILFCAVSEIQRLDDENAELKAQLERRWER
jgi:hypothetical protein